MDISYYKKYEPVFGAWRIVREIGDCPSGRVFEIERSEGGRISKAAMKVITVPSSQREIQNASASGMGPAELEAHFRSIAQKTTADALKLIQLKGHRNLVRHEEVAGANHDARIGWDIFIRTELPVPFIDHIRSGRLSSNDVIKMGIDLCRALETLQSQNIIYRDIRPETVYVSGQGDFMLGDFSTTADPSGYYTCDRRAYTAPEVARGAGCTPSSCVYSLGIILYRFLNRNRLPLQTPYPAPAAASDVKLAIERRLGGEALPAPQEAGDALAGIVLKACSYSPANRFSSPAEMRAALEALLRQPAAPVGAAAYTPPDSVGKPADNKKSKNGRIALIAGIAAVLLIAALLIVPMISNNSDKGERAHANGGYLDNEESSGGNEDTADDEDSYNTMVQVVAGYYHTVGLRPDGTVTAVGYNGKGQCNVEGWSHIEAICAGGDHTVGIDRNGNIVATGNNEFGQCNVSGWSDVYAISAGYNHTVGLRYDGTVVAAGDNQFGQCNVSGWSDIVYVCAGGDHTVGIRSDGTVVATGRNDEGQCNVSSWYGIEAVYCGGFHTVGLCYDGTVVAVGSNEFGQCSVSSWNNIVDIGVGYYHTVGLRSDGTVVAVGSEKYGRCDVDSWSSIDCICVGGYHTIAFRSDGTVYAVGYNEEGECNVYDWKLK